MIISINGPAGSGKSTIAKMLSEKLGWPRYYMGGLRRQKARERGLTLAEYNKLGETDPSTDTEVDEYQKKLGETDDNFVIEGRTSWYFIPHSVKLYLDVAERVGAERVFKELLNSEERNEDRNIQSVDDVVRSHRERRQSDNLRYRKYFNIDVYNPVNYDLVLDTTHLDKNEVFKKISAYIEKLLQK